MRVWREGWWLHRGGQQKAWGRGGGGLMSLFFWGCLKCAAGEHKRPPAQRLGLRTEAPHRPSLALNPAGYWCPGPNKQDPCPVAGARPPLTVVVVFLRPSPKIRGLKKRAPSPIPHRLSADRHFFEHKKKRSNETNQKKPNDLTPDHAQWADTRAWSRMRPSWASHTSSGWGSEAK